MNHWIKSVLMVAIAVAGTSPAAAPETGENNLIAERIAGTWELDEGLTRRIYPDFKKGKAIQRVGFTAVPDLAKNDAAIGAALNTTRPYFLGNWDLKIDGKELRLPFALITDPSGNTAILSFEKERNDDHYDTELNIVSFGRAVDPKDDILYIGGDHSREAMFALRRIDPSR